MRHTWLASGAVGILVTVATAQGAVKVAVMPFSAVSAEPTKTAWMGDAVQQNLVVILNQARDLQTLGPRTAVRDATTAARTGRTLGASYAVYGTCEVVGDMVRVTAQVVDTGTGDALATARAGGTVATFMKVEDELAEQLRSQVLSLSEAPAAPGLGATAPATTVQQPAPTVVVQPVVQPVVDTAYTSSYVGAYGYPFYSASLGWGGWWGAGWGGWWGWYPELVVFPIHRHHDCGWGHGGYWNGGHGWDGHHGGHGGPGWHGAPGMLPPRPSMPIGLRPPVQPWRPTTPGTTVTPLAPTRPVTPFKPATPLIASKPAAPSAFGAVGSSRPAWPMHTPPATVRPTYTTPTARPVVSSPTIVRPSVPAPVTVRPSVSAPMTARPTFSAPAAARPTFSAPMTARPTFSAPAAARPTFSAPMAARPSMSAPVAIRPPASGGFGRMR